MRAVERAQERFFLVVAAGEANGTLVHQFFVSLVAVGKARLTHAGRRANGIQRLIRVGDVKRPILAAEEAGRVERFQLLALADVEPLADVDERRHRRVARAKRAGDHRADVRGGDGLRRRVAGVPLVLVARVQNEPEVAGLVGADERAAIHHRANFLEPLGQLDVIHRRVDRREGAEHLAGREAFLERRVALGVKRLGVGHTAAHPEDDHAIGGGLDSLPGRLGQELARGAGGHGAKRCGTGGLEKVTAIPFALLSHAGKVAQAQLLGKFRLRRADRSGLLGRARLRLFPG